MTGVKSKISDVAVVGAGTMGAQIALLLALHGYRTILVDISNDALAAALERMKNDIRMIRMMQTGIEEIREDCISSITFTTELQGIAGAQLVIENISEKLELKKELYAAMPAYAGKDTIYAVNTSCIPISVIASMMPDPALVIGCHFMNPVYLKKLVEVVKSPFTGEDALASTGAFLKSIGKRYVVVRDSPGFVANRLSHMLMNEAANIISEKLCSPADLDLIFKVGYGHAMGPLETADLIGIDTVVDSLKVLEENTDDEKFRCSPLLSGMIERGELGRKTGKGFYTY